MRAGLKLTVLVWFFTALPALAQVPATSIGQVDTLVGKVTATTPDGAKLELAQGDPIFQGYIIVTGEEAAIGVVLADESVFSLDENSSLVLDTMVYDPAEGSGFAALSMIQGVFTFVSGQIAKASPDGMTIVTPSAEVGIRGTALGFIISAIGLTTVALLEEADGAPDGEALIHNDGGDQVINKSYQAVIIESFKKKPSKPFKMSLQDMGVRFGGAVRALPRAKKLIHKKIRDEAARQHKKRKAKKKAKKSSIRVKATAAVRQEEYRKNLRRMIKRYNKPRRVQNTFQPGTGGMDSLSRARKGAADRMRDAAITRPKPKPPSSSGGDHTAPNPCAGKTNTYTPR